MKPRKKRLSISAVKMLERIKDPLRYYYWKGPNPTGALKELRDAGLITDRCRVVKVVQCWVPTHTRIINQERYPK